MRYPSRAAIAVAVMAVLAAAASPAPQRPAQGAADDLVTTASRPGVTLADGELAGFVRAQRHVAGSFDDYSVAVQRDVIAVRSHGPRPLRLNLHVVGGDLHRADLRGRAYRATSFDGGHPQGRSFTVHRTARFRDVYPGIDLVLRRHAGELQYDFVVKPGADPADVRLRVDGSTDVRRDGSGLVVGTDRRQLRQSAPLIYQRTATGRRRVPGAFRLSGSGVTFSVGEYDTGRDLVIDPRVSYSTYLGGMQTEHVQAVGIDGSGDTFVGGHTWGTEFPTGTAVPAGRHLFVARLSAAGVVERVTFIGGDGEDSLADIAVAPDGSVAVTGTTGSTDFPTVNAYQSSRGSAGPAAYLVKLAPGGTSMTFSTYLHGQTTGGSGLSVAVGPTGDVYASGHGGYDFPRVNGWTAQHYPGYVGRFGDNGQPKYLTRFMVARALAVDASGAAYLADSTTSPGLPVKNAYQPAITPVPPNSNYSDVFAGKLSPDGATMDYATYLGGSYSDSVTDIAVDDNGRLAVVGNTWSTDFPTSAPLQGKFRGHTAGFISRLSPAGSTLSFSTFYGGAGETYPRAAAMDAQGRLNVVGWTSSWDLPLADPLQRHFAGGEYDAFWLRLPADAQSWGLSTYLGGETGDYGTAVGARGERVVIAGRTASRYFPTARPAQSGLQDPSVWPESDLFVTVVGGAPDRTYVARVEQTGTARGTVRSYPTGISCGADCAQTLPHGTMVNLEWDAPEGVKFTRWSDRRQTCAGRWDCVFPIDEDTTIKARFDEAIPPTLPRVSLKPDVLWQRQAGVNVRWHATDADTSVASYDVWYRSGWMPELWHTETTLESANMHPDIVGSNVCFAASARDRVDNHSDIGPYRCTAFPRDDAHLRASDAWRRKTDEEGHYNDTVSVASAQGARITTDEFGAYRLAVLVTKCPACGRLRVEWSPQNGSYRTLKTLDLSAGARRDRQVVPIASWDTMKFGKLRLVVASSDRPVLVDGVYSQYYRERELNR